MIDTTVRIAETQSSAFRARTCPLMGHSGDAGRRPKRIRVAVTRAPVTIPRPPFPEESIMKRFRGIHHLAMATRDMDKTIRYWRDLLGMRLAVGIGKPGYRHYFFEIAQGFFIAFFEWPDVEPVPEKDHGYPVSGPAVFDHVSFALEAEEELWELKNRLEAAGFWVSEIIDHGFIHSLYSYDPNGIPVEFSFPVRDMDFHETAAMIDSAPSSVTLEGPQPGPEKWPSPQAPIPPDERRVYPGEGLDLVLGKKRNHFA